MSRKIIPRAYFRKQFRDVMRNGTKTATTRTSKLGDPGDLFFVHGALFEVVSVQKVALTTVAAMFWRNEGCESEDDFIMVWLGIHGTFESDKLFWFHEFRRLPVGTALRVCDEGIEVLHAA